MVKPKPLPAIERIRELLDYDPVTGILRWRVLRGGAVQPGSIAGSPNKGYLRIMVDGCFFKAHRIAWLLAHGKDPGELQIDHINGIKTDNRIDNLRLANHSQNGCNRGNPSKNTSGFKGVYWMKHRRKWRARIRHRGRQISLGYYETAEEAHAAYAAAAKELHGDFARAA